MTTKEAVALLERYSNYDGMGIQNLVGCKEAMRVAVDALKKACPELGESEDERIRKELIGMINECTNWVHKNEYVKYLEKQKESSKSADSIPSDCASDAKCEDRSPKHSDSDGTDIRDTPAYWRGWDDAMKEQKQEWKPQPESLEALMYAIEGKWDMISPTSYLSRRLEDLYEGLVNTFNVDESLIAEVPKIASRAYTAEDIEELRELKHKIEASMEQKQEWSDYKDKVNVPYCSSEQEWSDNFEENIRNLLHDKLTWHSEDGSMSSTVFIDDKTLKDIINGIWFYVGKEALKYPSKELNVAEWSEEDETAFGDLLWCIKQAAKSAKDENDMGNVWFAEHWVKNRLKSLRPQYHGDVTMTEAYKMGKEAGEASHWKPTEDQMKALEDAFRKDGSDEYRRTINSLYQDLKKL